MSTPFPITDSPLVCWSCHERTIGTHFCSSCGKMHPDNYVNATPEEREISLKRSSELNDAYRTLREPVARVEYLLAIEGARVEGKSKQQAPPELLEEVL